MMRYQRVSPDFLPLSNGRKPNNHPRTCKEDEANYRVRSGSGSANPLQTHQENHFPPTSDPLPPDAQTCANGRDVLLQWGHMKRPRGSRAENRTAGEESTSSQSSRQTVRIQRRAAIAGAEKIAAAAAAAAMPPPCGGGGGGGGFARGANRSRPCTPLRDSAAINHHRLQPPLFDRMIRAVEERSNSQPRSDKNRSPPYIHKPAMSAAAVHNGFGPDSSPMNPHNRADPKAPSDQDAGKVSMEQFEWPRIYVSLSRKEKEDDFLAMKGTKLPQRPKKRAKNVDKSLQYCFPGMWLSDLTKGRYEVREKKCVKKKTRGLKGMESMESDSE